MAAGKGNQDGVEAGTADKEGSTDVSSAANQELENRLIQYIRVKWGGASNGLAWWSMHPNIP